MARQMAIMWPAEDTASAWYRACRPEAVLAVRTRRHVLWLLRRGEPPHMHGRRDNHIAKFWRDPVALGHSGDLNRSGPRRVERIVKENRTSFPGRWSARFNN